MSLVSRPVLDFELGGASACLEILGLKELIRHLLLDQVEARFVCPQTGQYRISEQVCGGGGGLGSIICRAGTTGKFLQIKDNRQSVKTLRHLSYR